jgi:hypothetical protein
VGVEAGQVGAKPRPRESAEPKKPGKNESETGQFPELGQSKKQTRPALYIFS